jgi:hypothetical protein
MKPKSKTKEKRTQSPKKKKKTFFCWYQDPSKMSRCPKKFDIAGFPKLFVPFLKIQ